MLSFVILGQILWRRVLERGYAGRIRTFGNVVDGESISVNVGVPALVRYCNIN